MSDADEAEFWRKKGEEWQAQFEEAQEKLSVESEEAEQRWKEMSEAAQREIEQIKEQDRKIKRRLKRRAVLLTIIGAATGVALIGGASQTAGFGSLLMNALGTGLLFVATVAVAAYFVSGYWKAATETPSNLIYLELQEVHRDLVHVQAVLESYVNRPERDLIFRLVIEETAKRQVEAVARGESDRELKSRVRQSGLLPPESGQENQAENS